MFGERTYSLATTRAEQHDEQSLKITRTREENPLWKIGREKTKVLQNDLLLSR